jgi:hypothetical protein
VQGQQNNSGAVEGSAAPRKNSSTLEQSNGSQLTNFVMKVKPKVQAGVFKNTDREVDFL